MKVAFIVFACNIAAALLIVAVAHFTGRDQWLKKRRPVVESCGEAGSAAGGTIPVGEMSADGARLRGGGVAPADLAAVQPSDSRPSVPAHEQLPGYRPHPDNRDWCNDFALAGALDAWSREGFRRG